MAGLLVNTITKICERNNLDPTTDDIQSLVDTGCALGIMSLGSLMKSGQSIITASKKKHEEYKRFSNVEDERTRLNVIAVMGAQFMASRKDNLAIKQLTILPNLAFMIRCGITTDNLRQFLLIWGNLCKGSGDVKYSKIIEHVQTMRGVVEQSITESVDGSSDQQKKKRLQTQLLFFEAGIRLVTEDKKIFLDANGEMGNIFEYDIDPGKESREDKTARLQKLDEALRELFYLEAKKIKSLPNATAQGIDLFRFMARECDGASCPTSAEAYLKQMDAQISAVSREEIPKKPKKIGFFAMFLKVLTSVFRKKTYAVSAKSENGVPGVPVGRTNWLVSLMFRLFHLCWPEDRSEGNECSQSKFSKTYGPVLAEQIKGPTAVEILGQGASGKGDGSNFSEDMKKLLQNFEQYWKKKSDKVTFLNTNMFKKTEKEVLKANIVLLYKLDSKGMLLGKYKEKYDNMINCFEFAHASENRKQLINRADLNNNVLVMLSSSIHHLIQSAGMDDMAKKLTEKEIRAWLKNSSDRQKTNFVDMLLAGDVCSDTISAHIQPNVTKKTRKMLSVH